MVDLSTVAPVAATGLDLGLISPRGRYAQPVRSVWVLAHGHSPTTDIYLKPRLDSLAARYVDTSRQAPPPTLADGAFVVIARHAPRPWLRWLKARREALAGVALLLDDDIPGVLGGADLPLLYALKTAYRYVSTKALLAEVCDAVWVSTPWLQRKYAQVPTRLVAPLYVGAVPEPGAGPATYFYHGTSAHASEMAFLVEVVRQVQARLPNALFEIVGGAAVRRLFRGIPRVRVLHPMAWPDFLAWSSAARHRVGLAPLLDTPFNQARSHNKLFDITRCGAAGVYSDLAVYRGTVLDGHSGLLRPNRPEAWIEAIIRLLADEAFRDGVFRNALAWCEARGTDRHFALRPAGVAMWEAAP